MTSLVAVLSVIGLAVSLAIQGTLSNLAGGIQVLLSKPFKAGDYVEAGGISGTVMEVGLAYTKLCTVDNKVISVPNGQISGEKIINYSTEERRRVDLTFNASYDSPLQQVTGVLRAVVAAHPMPWPSRSPLCGSTPTGTAALSMWSGCGAPRGITGRCTTTCWSRLKRLLTRTALR